MFLRKLAVATIAAAVTTGTLAVTQAVADEQFIPVLSYRSGPYAPNGIPFANGFVDYIKMLNARDGGVGGVTLTFEECDTGYNTDRGVECYERLKKNGPTGASVFNPLSTGITYALIERATQDKIPIISMGYGRTSASDGRVFPYVFTLPATYWAQADAMVQYVKAQEKGNLKGKKIALVYHDSAYGKEPIATLEKLSADLGFEFHKFPVAHPGLEQKAVWLQIGRQLRPDWVLMWGWGVMNSTAIKEAAAVGYPMDRFIGVWWSSAEPDVEPAGAAAKGYKGGAFHAPGDGFPVHKDIYANVYDKNNGTGERPKVGEVLYNRGMINALFVTEAIRTAQDKFGKKSLTGEEVRWGIENLDLNADKLAKLGFGGMMEPIKLSCADHEGGGKVRIQQWDGAKWSFVSDWITPNRGMLRPMYEEAAAAYATEQKIEPRNCGS